MVGGYIDDKWCQGDVNSEAYSNWHWYLMDIFVYFSHNLVTIPPPCWVNTAHTHGVQVLGTFIAEWDEGKLVCNELLATKESAQMYAERLSKLAVALGFDGWLINIEVKLDVKQIPNMKEFVNHLIKTMHSSMPGSLVIWYDSVTIDGDLLWQDQLNEKNKPFFDLYYPKLSAKVAGERKYDVYMGIDVFGRNTFGGGQWTTYIALDVLKKDDVSAAIFAPGWKSWGVLQRYPKSLPFYSNFDQGHGYHFSVDGRQVSKNPWCNISCQTFQPVLEISEESLLNPMQVTVDFKEASYNGGGSILWKGEKLKVLKLFIDFMMSQECHDRGWMTEDRFSDLYREGVQFFIDFAYKNRLLDSPFCPCPCRLCRNKKSKSFAHVEHDLLVHGMLDSYFVWSLHGEKSTPASASYLVHEDLTVQEEMLREEAVEVEEINDTDGCRLKDFVDNAFGMYEGLNEDVGVGDPFIQEPNLGKKHDKYKKLAEEKIYPSCVNGTTTLSVIVELHHVKKRFG
ncbi:hypothetical protein MKW94_021153, partial [Papaver nudicaule]|nr:hypothetical protein [Papaver nudicaule]